MGNTGKRLAAQATFSSNRPPGPKKHAGAENRERKTARPHEALDERLARIVRQVRIETGIGDRRPHQTRDARGNRRIDESGGKADGLQMGGPRATMATWSAIMPHPVGRGQDVNAVESLLKNPRITGVRKGLNPTGKRIRIGNRAAGEGNDAATRGQKTGRHEAAGVRPGTGNRDSERGRQTEEPPKKFTPTRVGRKSRWQRSKAENRLWTTARRNAHAVREGKARQVPEQSEGGVNRERRTRDDELPRQAGGNYER